MLGSLSSLSFPLILADISSWIEMAILIIKVVIGFSLIIFVHELGHFLAAKWVGIRVDRFAVGFGHRLFGWRSGEGFTFGSRPNYTGEELNQRGWGETDYCFKLLPLGGYVKMLGQDDVQINDDTGEIKLSDDPRAFTNKTVGQRMIVVSAGVIFNMIFAIIGFACAFMIGLETLAPTIMVSDAGSPAARAGLMTGDEIIAANGNPVKSFRDIRLAQLLTDRDGARVEFTVKRNGKVLDEPIVLQQSDEVAADPGASGISPAADFVLEENKRFQTLYPELKAGDRLVMVGDRKIESSEDWLLAFANDGMLSGRGTLPAEFERKTPDGKTETNTVMLHGSLQLVPEESVENGQIEVRRAGILGLVPLQVILLVEPDSAAEEAGVMEDDIVVQWGTVLYPRYSEILEVVQESADVDVPVVVLRDGKRVELTLRPRRPFQLLRTSPPKAGVAFGADYSTPIVADVVEDTPAAALRIPRGARLTAVNGKPVQDWLGVILQLRAAAGSNVTVKYSTGDVNAEGEVAVPSSIVNALNLPPSAQIIEIDGKHSLTIGEGQKVRLPTLTAVSQMLAEHAGESVRVVYRASAKDPTLHEAQFAVAADKSNVDPWQGRIALTPPAAPFRFELTRLQTNNPVTAMTMALGSTRDVLSEIYTLLRKIVTGIGSSRPSAARHVSGPVGIIGAAVQQAKTGFAALLHFLAFLSVNLAVINFLPFPVVDGGLMVFLIIEKIKGKPLSLKTQMVATLVGLATIVLVFLLVTIQDISRFFG